MPLPEKDYFTLAELIERWKAQGCDMSTLLDYARRDLLRFSVYMRDIGSHRRKDETPDGVRIAETTVLRFVAPGFEPSFIRYLSANDARRILEARPTEAIAISLLYSSPAREKERATAYMQPLHLTVEDLIITREERDRFENENKLRVAVSRLKKALHWINDNQKALTVIGATIAGLSAGAWQLYVWFVSRQGGGAP